MSNRSHASGAGWLVPIGRPTTVKQSLVCFPYAGGSPSAFRGWNGLLPDTVALAGVQFPGRERRYREPLTGSILEAAAEIAEAMEPLLAQQVILFGHSMGSIVAYETARRLLTRYGIRPLALIVSGRRAPHLPRRRAPVHDLPDAEFLAEIRRLGGTPAEVFVEPELLNLVLPILRSDMRLIETYVPPAGPTLECSILAMGGIDDADVVPAELEAWRQTTTGPGTVRLFAGDHFFLNEQAAAVIAAIGEVVGWDCPPATRTQDRPILSP